MAGIPMGAAKLVQWTKENGQKTKWHGIAIHKKLGVQTLTYCGRRTHEADIALVVSSKRDAPGGLDALCGRCFDV